MTGEAADPPVAAAAPACANCGAAMQGRYCHDCGSRPFAAEDYSLRRFARSAFQEITDLDHSKLLRTLKALFLSPGLLSQEYFSARRVRYVKPIALLLTVFALHIFAYSASQEVALFNLDVALKASPNPETAEKFVSILERAASRRDISTAELIGNINDKWARNFSWSQVPQVLAFTLLLQLIFLFSRRHFIEHLVFAMHFYAFQVLTVTLMWPLYYAVGLKLSAAGIGLGVVKFVIDIAYVFFAAQRFYGGHAAKALVRAVVIFIAYTAVYLAAYFASMLTALTSEAPPSLVNPKLPPVTIPAKQAGD